MRRSIRNKNKISDLSITDQAVLALTANALFDARRPVPAGADWQQVYEECCHQAVPALGLRGAQAAEVPENILKKWRQTVIAAAYNNLRVSWEHNELDRLMKSAKIPYVILKGCASALYYPRPAERVMGDVDFLVKKRIWSGREKFWSRKVLFHGMRSISVMSCTASRRRIMRCILNRRACHTAEPGILSGNI